jgi:hypothetical protein
MRRCRRKRPRRSLPCSRRQARYCSIRSRSIVKPPGVGRATARHASRRPHLSKGYRSGGKEAIRVLLASLLY